MSSVSRALVLGGGGITGIAWELGMLAGLAEAGLDIMEPDLVVGTSAGSVVGAQILSGEPIEALYAKQLVDPAGEAGGRIGAGALARFVIASAWPGNGGRGRAYLGRAALAASTHPESESRAAFERLVTRDSWPERRLLVTAVDAETGEPRAFDRDSGVELRDAVAASCAVPIVWPPITIQGHRYIDGGVRSVTNADLAAGCDCVIVLAPVTFAMRRSSRISRQLASLGRDVRSLVLSPDAEARAAIGRNVLDPAQRAASARAGRRQGAMVAPAVEEIWSTRLPRPSVSGT